MNALYEWYEVAQQLAQLKAREITLRRQVFDEYFPEPQEGANKVEIPGNAILTATLPYNYTLDPETVEEALELVPASKRDKLVEWSPKLKLSVYRTLSKKALNEFTAECLTIKPGTPSLKITPVAE